MKKTLGIILALLLCTGMLLGCGGNETAADADTSTAGEMWYGIHENENGYVTIDEYDGEKLQYTFEMNDGTYMNGYAEVSGDTAQTDALHFTMDGNLLTVSVSEVESGNPDFEMLAGEYSWVEEKSTDNAPAEAVDESDFSEYSTDETADDSYVPTDFTGYWYEADTHNYSYCLAIYEDGTYAGLNGGDVEETGTYAVSTEEGDFSTTEVITFTSDSGTETHGSYFMDTLDIETEDSSISFLPGPEPMDDGSYVENTGDVSVLVGNWYPNGDEDAGVITFYDDYSYEWLNGTGYTSYDYIFDGTYIMLRSSERILRCELQDENTIWFEKDAETYIRADS